MNADQERWVTYAGRAGRLAQGFIFLCVGLLSAWAALRGGGRATDSRRALHTIVQQPFGQAVLLALIAGLVCYVLYRLLAAFADVEGQGSDAKGLALRARSLGIAFIYGGITAAAVRTVLGSRSGRGGGDQAARDWTERVMATPLGSSFVILIGTGIVVAGGYQCLRAWRRSYEKRLQLDQLPGETQRWVTRICAFGIAARGLVFTILGVFLIQAGLQSDPSKARGLSGALDSLHAHPYGRWLFAIVALGLAAYGIYCCVRARYGKIGRT